MTENELLAELTAELLLEPIKSDEVTAQDLAKSAGISSRAASVRLEKGVREGELEWRWIRTGAARSKAYRKAKVRNKTDPNPSKSKG
jgi:predicted ArsR family transcriptional regulator